MTGLSLALILATTTVFAGFSVGNITKKAGNMAKNKVVVSEINKKISKHNCNSFKAESKEVASSCNWSGLIKDLKTYREVLGATGIANISFYIKAHGPDKRDKAKGNINAYDRGSHVRQKLYGEMNWWSYNVRSIPDSNSNTVNKLELVVQAK